MAGFEAGTEYKTADGKRIGKNPDDGFGRNHCQGSFFITMKRSVVPVS